MIYTIITGFQHSGPAKKSLPTTVCKIFHFFLLLVSFIFYIMMFNLNNKAG